MKWNRIWDYFKFNNPEHLTLFDRVAKGDSSHEKRLLLLILRIIHAGYLLTVPVAVIALAVIFPAGFIPYSKTGTLDVPLLAFGIIFYIFVALLTFLFFKWQVMSKWSGYTRNLYLIDLYLSDIDQKLYMDVILSYIFRIGMCIESAVAFAFLLKMLGGSWGVVIPLFMLSIILFILIYPTNRRLLIWLNKQKSQDSKF